VSAAQRRKGQAGEREAAALLTDEFGFLCRRTLDQPREGGSDVPCGRFKVEVKRRKKLGMHAWVKQAQRACGPDDVPIVLARGDGEDWLVVVPFAVAAKWMREDM
jgi:hypothetical protein